MGRAPGEHRREQGDARRASTAGNRGTRAGRAPPGTGGRAPGEHRLKPAGRATTKREPPNPFFSIQTRPPIASISRLAANSPIPEPRDRARSTRTYGWNTASQSSIGTPGPSSVM